MPLTCQHLLSARHGAGSSAHSDHGRPGLRAAHASPGKRGTDKSHKPVGHVRIWQIHRTIRSSRNFLEGLTKIRNTVTLGDMVACSNRTPVNIAEGGGGGAGCGRRGVQLSAVLSQGVGQYPCRPGKPPHRLGLGFLWELGQTNTDRGDTYQAGHSKDFRSPSDARGRGQTVFWAKLALDPQRANQKDVG